MSQDNHDNKPGTDTGPDRTNTGRRRMLQALGVGGAIVGAHTLPEKWTRPVVDAVSLPAHAQTSPGGSFFGQSMQTVESMVTGKLIDPTRLPVSRVASAESRSWLDYLISPAAATEDAVGFIEASIDDDGECILSVRVEGTVPDFCLEEEKEDPIPIDFTICWRGRFKKVAKGEGAELDSNCPDDIEADKVDVRIVDLGKNMLELETGPSGDGFRIDLTRSDTRADCPSCDKELLALKEECAAPGP